MSADQLNRARSLSPGVRWNRRGPARNEISPRVAGNSARVPSRAYVGIYIYAFCRRTGSFFFAIRRGESFEKATVSLNEPLNNDVLASLARRPVFRPASSVLSRVIRREKQPIELSASNPAIVGVSKKVAALVDTRMALRAFYGDSTAIKLSLALPRLRVKRGSA